MELLTVRFETDCKDAARLRPVVEKIRRSRELRRPELRTGAIGLDLEVHVAPGVSEGHARSVLAPLWPPGVLVSRTFSTMGEPPEEEDGPGSDDPAVTDTSDPGQEMRE